MYRQRTGWNVRDSNGTLVLYWGELHGGTLTTVTLARDKYRHPLSIVNLLEPLDARKTADWIGQHSIEILNVAGPRESARLGIYDMARDYLIKMFELSKEATTDS